MATEANYPVTPAGTVELKRLPALRVLEAVDPGEYFAGGGRPFNTLFRYIQRHQVAMTTPVEADLEPARMRFFVPRKHAGETPSEPAGVRVFDRPARQVLAAGLRGEYSKRRFEAGVRMLRDWMAQHPEWTAAGEPYAVFWDGPFVPGFLKRSEVHLPVAPASTPAAPR